MAAIFGFMWMLQPCVYKDFEACVNSEIPKTPRWGLCIFAFTLVHFFIFLNGIREKRFAESIYAVVVFQFFTHVRPGYDWYNHGSYAQLACYIFLGMIAVMYIIFKIVQRSFRSCPKLTVVGIILFAFLSRAYLDKRILDSKKFFERGFNNVWLDNTHPEKPAMCPLRDYYFPNYDFGAPIFTQPVFLFAYSTCAEQRKSEEYQFYNPKINKDIEHNNFQVYPDILNISNEDYNQFTRLQNYYTNNMKFYKKKSDFKADSWIDFTDRNSPKFGVDIQERAFPDRDFKKSAGRMNIIV
jgi:hypothetical protein